MRKALNVIISLIVVAILVVIDQISKFWIVKNMVPYKDEKKVIDGVFSLRYIKNSGAAWGSFSGKTILLLVISIILIIALLYVYKNIIFEKKYIELKICILFILGGAIGNMIDRIRLGFVIDFIEAKFINFPIFNFADICVTVCMFVVLALFLFKYKDEDMDIMFARNSKNTIAENSEEKNEPDDSDDNSEIKEEKDDKEE